MLVLTVGNSYVDIDGYASCIAYRELLKMRGEEAMFVTDALFKYALPLPSALSFHPINVHPDNV